MNDLELSRLPRHTLTERQRLDLEQILCGGFAPLTGFLTEADYNTVVSSMRLADGTLWPMPITLDVSPDHGYEVGMRILLCDQYGYMIATMTIESIFTPDKDVEARAVYGTDSVEHPGVRYLVEQTHDVYLGGPVELIAYAPAHDFQDLRMTPHMLKAELARRGWDTVVAFQTRNPMHRAHYEIVRHAMRMIGGNALIHPVAGLTKEGDIDYVRRVRGYRHVVKKYFEDNALLAVLPIAMRMAGPREALWHALIRKNYGATHFIVGRDHAGVSTDAGAAFYEPYAAQQLAHTHQPELGVTIVDVPEMIYSERKRAYLPITQLPPDDTPAHLSGTTFRRMLQNGEAIPEWFSFPEVIQELRASAHDHGGMVIFFTGLPSAGKTTIARMLYQKLLERNIPDVQLIDGDVMRNGYAQKLGFSRRDRITNIERIGTLAASIARAGGIAICAAVAPHEEARRANRERITRDARYIEIFVNTPLSVCETRDTKGLYKKARAGFIRDFTGIDDPYEIPENPELTLDTETHAPEACVEQIMSYVSSIGALNEDDSRR